MKRLALVGAVLAVAACTTREKTEVRDTAAPAMAPAPATTTDTGMKMGTDTGMRRDTMMRDTGMMKTKTKTKRP
jgi:hypothetical protein